MNLVLTFEYTCYECYRVTEVVSTPGIHLVEDECLFFVLERGQYDVLCENVAVRQAIPGKVQRDLNRNDTGVAVKPVNDQHRTVGAKLLRIMQETSLLV